VQIVLPAVIFSRNLNEEIMHRINFGLIKNIDISENWGLLPDPMERCRAQKWWKSIRKENYWFPSYDDDAFWPTKVPGAFNLQHPQLEYYEGTVVYLKHFSAEIPEKEEKVFLHFESVNERCAVFLNGAYIGEHEGGNTAFTFDVTDALEKENRLMVLVNAERKSNDVPGKMHDWFHDAGITRPVKLYYRPQSYVRDVAVNTILAEDGKKVKVEIKVMAESRDRFKPLEAEITLSEPKSGKTVITEKLPCKSGAWSSIEVTLPVEKLRLWSTDDPFQYKLIVKLQNDLWEDEVGLREVTISGREILLNRQPVKLRGIATWIDDPDRGLFSMGEKTSEETIKLLKDLNCNLARAGHRPQSQEFIRACNRNGILVWQEVPAYWIPTMQKPAESRKALKSLEETLCEHRNAASIIIWSVGNECLYKAKDEEQSNLAYFLEATDYLHEHDPGRLVTYTGGIEGTGENPEAMEMICPQSLVEKVDIVSFNSYSGIDDGAEPGKPELFYQQYEKARLASSWGKPVIHAEIGIDAVAGEQGFDFGEARQNDYHLKIQQYAKECFEEGCLQGVVIFVLNDFRTPIKLGKFQKGYNRKGIVTEKLEKKQAYHSVKTGYGQLKELF
jgi:beta-glucuronidase